MYHLGPYLHELRIETTATEAVSGMSLYMPNVPGNNEMKYRMAVGDCWSRWMYGDAIVNVMTVGIGLAVRQTWRSSMPSLKIAKVFMWGNA